MMPNVLAVVDFGISGLPPEVFMVVHFAALTIATLLVWKALQAQRTALAWAFGLYGVTEILYMFYHVQPPITTFLFSHTLAEVLNLVAFVLVFVGALYQPQKRPATLPTPATEEPIP